MTNRALNNNKLQSAGSNTKARIRIPRKLLAECEKLEKMFLDTISKDWPDDLSKAIRDHNDKYGSAELKAFEQYLSRTGDEGELREKDGSYILDQDGYRKQDWKNSEDGFLRDSKGNQIYYKDGSPIPNIEMPDCIRKMYEEE